MNDQRGIMNKEKRDKFLDDLSALSNKYNQEPTFTHFNEIQNDQLNLIKQIINALIEENKGDEEYSWEKFYLLTAIDTIKKNKIQNRPNAGVMPSYINQKLPCV